MDVGVAGKTVLVQAATRGLGFAVAKAFASEGALVAITGRDENRLEEAVADIQSSATNQNVMGVICDLSRVDQLDHVFQVIERRWGGVDVLINNTGGPPVGAFAEVDDAQWQEAFDLCLMSFIRSTRRVLPHMQEQRWGRIVNIASSSIRQPVDRLILSNTFRAGVLGLAKSLATELAPYNILINTLGPGRIATDRVASLDRIDADKQGISVAEVQRRWYEKIPMGRYGQPDEFAQMALFLGSAANGYVTGQAVLVDGGMVRSL
ncbi:MAG: SDR family oxidoreductase [Alicyclobacillus shizuokensis]|nr:SDR family oxidoreductase [Alicyclobacillus shizuokensis]